MILTMKKQMSHWATVLDLIEAGLSRDVDKTRNYAALLADRLQEVGETAVAARIRRILESTQISKRAGGNTSSIISPAQTAFAPVDPESRSSFIDESKPLLDRPPVLNPPVFAEINRFIQLQRHADHFVREGIPMPRSILLYGPPGCGKSTTAQFVAHELGLPLLTVRLDAVMSSFLGTTAKNLRTVFEHASHRSAVLFLDEFDALAKMRDDSNEIGEIKRLVNSLIQNLDAFPRLYVIAATYQEHLLDSAIWRRFDFVVHLQLPSSDERMTLLRQFLSQTGIEESDLRWIATMTEGCSGGDLEQIAIRTRQENLLSPDVPAIHLLVREVWWRMEGSKLTSKHPVEDRSTLITFIDSRTHGKIPARTIEMLTGIPDSTVARIRRAKGETITYD